MAAMRKQAASGLDAQAETDPLVDLVWKLYIDALQALPRTKVAETAGQWLAKADAADEDIFARAMVLAMDLEAFTPSLGGVIIFDRLARRRKVSAEEAAALSVLKAARMVPFRIAGASSDMGSFTVESLVGAGTLTVFDDGVRAEAVGATAIARLCALPDGTFCTLGPITPLDETGLGVALDFLARGKRSAHDHRCAAAVYRHIVRHGNPKVHGLNYHPELEDDGAEPGYAPGPADIAASAWSELGGASPPEELVAQVRAMAGVDAVIEGLFKAFALSSEHGLRGRADAYRAIVELQMETLLRRAETGVGRVRRPFETIAEAIEQEVALHGYPLEAKALFESLRAKLVARTAPKEADDALTKVIERIRALRAKTLDQGCTESEAMAAAAKVAELLDRYGLTLSAVDIETQRCESIGIESSRKRAGPLDECLQSIATFCDCKAWQEQTAGGFLRSVLFGLPADVEAAHFLYGRVAAAFETETAAFKAGDFYLRTETGARRRATTSFQIGLSEGIHGKLTRLKAERDEVRRGASGRDLVPLKTAAVEEDAAKLGLRFTAKQSASRLVRMEAYRAGQVAGRKFEPREALD